MQKVRINSDLKFDYEDLMREVDTSGWFSLGEILRACQNSKIPQDVLCRILRCNHIFDLCNESDSKDFEGDGNIEYLRLRYAIDITSFSGEVECESSWIFDGVGKLGCYDESMKDYILENEKATYREHYAIEYTPVYALKGYIVKIEKGVAVLDWRKDDSQFEKGWVEDYTPSITLQNLLYHVFWELTWCGSPKDRDASLEHLKGLVDDIKNNSQDKSKQIDIDELKSRFDKE